MNTSFSGDFEDCVPVFRARGLRPRPGMTRLQFKLTQYRETFDIDLIWNISYGLRRQTDVMRDFL
jgi:hypothetical protein